MINAILIIIFIGVGAWGAYLLKALTISGSIAAFIVGGVIAAGFGLKGIILLSVFFASSSFWSSYKRSKKSTMEERLEKGSQRDWQQVAANGGAAAIASIIFLLVRDPVWMIVFCTAIACANSDTWASEIGSLSKGRPIFIKTWKRVDRGTSGAISVLGTFAALMGSLLIAISADLLFSFNLQSTMIIFSLGFFGNLVDTWLGAYLQAEYTCCQCGLITEKIYHCDQKNKKTGGLTIFNNELVNFSACLCASIFVFLLY